MQTNASLTDVKRSEQNLPDGSTRGAPARSPLISKLDQLVSDSIAIAPHGHSAAQMPQPLQ